MSSTERSVARYGLLVLCVAGLGGLLYGIDVGIISVALVYLGKTVNLSLYQESFIVSAVFVGSILSSLVTGFVADWVGRKKMMILSGALFIASVAIIFISHTFALLLAGRLLQGLSGGVIAVVVPLYLAECLPPANRGKGSALFQFFLTIGIVAAIAIGAFYSHGADKAIEAAKGDATLILAAQNHAWRGMYLSIIYPGMVFFVGAFALAESPRWLHRKHRRAEALQSLLRISQDAEAEEQMREMDEILANEEKSKQSVDVSGSLLQRKYVLPFILACVILACNQATGINSILSYAVLIFRQAGMTVANATHANLAITILNSLMTIVAVSLIDRRGRKFLLTLGTGGIVIALLLTGILFHSVEASRTDRLSFVQAHVVNNSLTLEVPADVSQGGSSAGRPASLNVTYSYGNGDHVASGLSDDKDPFIRIAPDPSAKETAPLTIKRATYGIVPSEKTGWVITMCISLFMAAFGVGPGVVVWLALSELMPTRIRSAGMGIALFINQGISAGIAGVFLPVVARFGYSAMFFFWAACTVIYFITAAFFLPETKGRTLEQIEEYFEGKAAA